jgi:hypothetical protein
MAAQDTTILRLQTEASANSERMAALRMRNEQLERLAAASSTKTDKIKEHAARLAAAETQLRETRAQASKSDRSDSIHHNRYRSFAGH